MWDDFDMLVAHDPDAYFKIARCTCGRHAKLIGTSEVDSSCEEHCDAWRAGPVAKFSGDLTAENGEYYWRWGEPQSNAKFKKDIYDFHDAIESGGGGLARGKVVPPPPPRFKVRGILRKAAGKRKRAEKCRVKWCDLKDRETRGNVERVIPVSPGASECRSSQIAVPDQRQATLVPLPPPASPTPSPSS